MEGESDTGEIEGVSNGGKRNTPMFLGRDVNYLHLGCYIVNIQMP